MNVFHTERLTLRPFRHDDWQRLQHYVSQEIVTRYDHAYPTSDEDCQGICDWFAQEEGFWAVALAGSDMLIGHVVSRQADPPESRIWGIGFVFDPDYWGQSYAFEAGQRILTHVIKDQGAQRISASCAVDNARSWRLLERLGFAREAHRPGAVAPKQMAQGETGGGGTYDYVMSVGTPE